MTRPEARKIGLANAIAATGILAKAKAPPPNIPAHKHVIINRSPFDAPAKNSNGIAAQRLPNKNALRMTRLMERFETEAGLALRLLLDLIPNKIAQATIMAANTRAHVQSGDFRSATIKMSALHAFASIIHGKYWNITLICSARTRPATSAFMLGPPKYDRSPADISRKARAMRLSTSYPYTIVTKVIAC